MKKGDFYNTDEGKAVYLGKQWGDQKYLLFGENGLNNRYELDNPLLSKKVPAKVLIYTRKEDDIKFSFVKIGRKIYVSAGCRAFTKDEAIEHWGQYEGWYDDYTDQRDRKNAQSLKLIDRAVKAFKRGEA